MHVSGASEFSLGRRRNNFQIPELFHRKRLDEFLFNEFRNLSKAYIRRVIKEGNCEVNGYLANSGTRLSFNDFVEITIDEKFEKGMTPDFCELNIVYEDLEIIVLNKPAGMLVHPTNFERNETLLNALTYYLNANSNNPEIFIRPHLIHRLDRETSGLIVVAKNPFAAAKLCNHVKRKLFHKHYLAILEGCVEVDSASIDAPIGRFEDERLWNVKPDGKEAQTRLKVIRRNKIHTLVELQPITGRTNQLRIHCAYKGYPIVGDVVFGAKPADRMCLHASKLLFRHPVSNVELRLESKKPDFVKDFN